MLLILSRYPQMSFAEKENPYVTITANYLRSSISASANCSRLFVFIYDL